VQTQLKWKKNKFYMFEVWICSLRYSHAMFMRLIVICRLPSSSIFFHIIS